MSFITATQANAIKPNSKPIAHGVKGLYLHPTTSKGHGKWILRFTSPTTSKRRDMGLGSYPEISIADAGTLGRNARALIEVGKDPIEERNSEREHKRLALAIATWTFEKAARQVHTELKPSWKNKKHSAQWISTLETYVFPTLGTKQLDTITPKDVAEVLRPIWLEKAETASRTKQRIHAVMAWAWAHGYVSGNPVDVIDRILPKQPEKRARTEHQPAMPWAIIPAFFKEVLRERPKSDSTKSLLEFLILTASRSGEVRGMQWNEIDFVEKIWTIPANRMKAKRTHRVPLSDRAIEILEKQRKDLKLDSESRNQDKPLSGLVFPSPRRLMLSDMCITALLRRAKAESSTPERTATAHGFRSSFRDWASEHGYSHDLAERALAHSVKNLVEAAYHRTDLLEQRRPMMQAWADYLHSIAAIKNKLVRLKAA
ncbi:MAG: tyrosine-type recombinase/integrase [Burkholderiales bacterium]|nr:tyrosine-type recombinase/integrase [Burkholderiales bacterium]